MDLTSSACAASVASARDALGNAVLGKAMDAQRVEGQASVKLIETAGQVARGAAEPGKGQRVDRTA